MNEEDIINLWNKGYTRGYLYDEEYKVLKNKFCNIKRKSKDLREEAIRNIENALYNDYMKNLKKGRRIKNEH